MSIKHLLRRLGIMRERRIGNYLVLYHSKLYQVWEETHLRKVFARYDVDCVFDVGANYGQYAQMLRDQVEFKGLIISLEPIPAAAAALREKSRDDPKWVVEEIALSSHDGTQQFNIMSESEFSSLSEPRHDEVDMFRGSTKITNSVTVRTETLITAYHRLRRAHNFERPFLKLDTQGYDVDIVSHGKPVMQEFIGLQSELAIKKIYKHSIDFRDAIQVYQDCGFALSAFVPNNEGHFPRLIETDCIMIRENLM
jgi:FkbM family methyltransferase